MKLIKKIQGKLGDAPNRHRHIRIESEEEVSVNTGQTFTLKKSKTKLLAVFLIILVGAYLILSGQCKTWWLCATKRPFSTNPPYDDQFYFSLYNHWRNTTCDEVPSWTAWWLRRIWGPSPFKKETMIVMDQHFADIDKTKVITSNKLLIGVSSKSSDFQRRQLIRAHQINRYNSSLYDITWKFVMFTPKSQYLESIRHENNTYGDIIILTSYNDSREDSRTYKPFEWFKYVEKSMPMYKYVAKLDTDCFLNIPLFWKGYFNETVQELDYAIVALFIEQVGKFVWPMGAFEAISWKTMLALNRLYEKVNITDEAEDLQLGWYLYDAEINFTKIAFPTELAYDFRQGCNPSWWSDVSYNALRIHELKLESDYINVANCFNATGVDKNMVELGRLYNWTL
jgi:hypothetical protein